MKLAYECFQCLLKQAFYLAGKHIGDNDDRLLFMTRVMREMGGIGGDTIAPLVASKIHRILRESINNDDPYWEDKCLYNQKMLSCEKDFEGFIAGSENRLSAAVKLAVAGNVIDFGAIPDLKSSEVFQEIQEARDKDFSSYVFDQLASELEQAETLLYLGDNAGEIVLDKLLIKEINRRYPKLKIYFATRGKPIINDVIEYDAISVGIDKYACVISNGTDIPGTVLSECSENFIKVFETADVVISKGQGNFESLVDSSRKIYFMFLCKCSYFEKKLGIGKHEIMLYCNR